MLHQNAGKPSDGIEEGMTAIAVAVDIDQSRCDDESARLDDGCAGFEHVALADPIDATLLDEEIAGGGHAVGKHHPCILENNRRRIVGAERRVGVRFSRHSLQSEPRANEENHEEGDRAGGFWATAEGTAVSIMARSPRADRMSPQERKSLVMVVGSSFPGAQIVGVQGRVSHFEAKADVSDWRFADGTTFPPQHLLEA